MQLEQVCSQLGSKIGTADKQAEHLQLEGETRTERESVDCPSWGKQTSKGCQEGHSLPVCSWVSLLVWPLVASLIPVLKVLTQRAVVAAIMRLPQKHI